MRCTQLDSASQLLLQEASRIEAASNVLTRSAEDALVRVNSTPWQRRFQRERLLAELKDLLPDLWSRESSGFPFEWSENNPSYGQCYCTARLVQAMFGGDLIHQKLRFQDGDYDHFVNEIGGVRYDLPSDQMAGEEFVVLYENYRTAKNTMMFEWLSWIHYRVEALFKAYERKTGIRPKKYP